MAPSRAYVPSTLLLRSFLRPLPRQCPLSRRISTTPIRRNAPKASPKTSSSSKKRSETSDDPRNGLNDSGISSISWYEQDVDGKTPERFISSISNEEELSKFQEDYKLMEKAEKGGGDDTELRRRMLDDLMRNPNFADLQEELGDMKKDLNTGEHKEEMEYDWKEELLKELINDPEMEEHKESLLDLQARLPQIVSEGGIGSDKEFEDALEQLNLAAAGVDNPDIQKRLDSLNIKTSEPREPDDIIPAGEQLAQDDMDTDSLDALMQEMQQLMKAAGTDSELMDELKAIQADKINVKEDGDEELDWEDLEKQFAEEAAELEELELEDEEAPADENSEYNELAEKLLQDPKLMEKLALIRSVVEKHKAVQQQSAPDPDTLPSSEIVPLQEQLQAAQKDPEHIIALRRLRVDLLPPHNVSPQLKALNDALQLAYIGANEEVRRVLWKAYSKAKYVPGLLERIPDDAWDIIWYSQAVDWKGNANRENHLRILERDLADLGRDGPPTKSFEQDES